MATAGKSESPCLGARTVAFEIIIAGHVSFERKRQGGYFGDDAVHFDISLFPGHIKMYDFSVFCRDPVHTVIVFDMGGPEKDVRGTAKNLVRK